MTTEHDEESDVQAALKDPDLGRRFAERAGLAMDKCALFRRGRGRSHDFHARYQIGRVFAGKILSGAAEPPLAVLKALAIDTNVTADYLLGLTDDPAPAGGGASAQAAEVQTRPDQAKRLGLYEVTSEGLTRGNGGIDVPQSSIPYRLWSSELIAVRWRSRSAESYVAYGGFLVVEVTSMAVDCAAHLVLWNGLRAEILQIGSERGGETYALLTFDDRTDSVPGSQVRFGLAESGEGEQIQLRVVGPIVGRIEMSEQGIRIAPPKSTGARFVNLATP